MPKATQLVGVAEEGWNSASLTPEPLNLFRPLVSLPLVSEAQRGLVTWPGSHSGLVAEVESRLPGPGAAAFLEPVASLEAEWPAHPWGGARGASSGWSAQPSLPHVVPERH